MFNLFLVICGFLFMELISIFFHKFLFHGFLWSIHRTHHVRTKKRIFELNDVFSLGFSLLSIYLMTNITTFHFAVGMTIYGMLYFFAHDVLTHQRFFSLRINFIFFERLVRSHRFHHRSIEKNGCAPYGFLSGLFYAKKNSISS